jgi:hypothetical protein
MREVDKEYIIRNVTKDDGSDLALDIHFYGIRIVHDICDLFKETFDRRNPYKSEDISIEYQPRGPPLINIHFNYQKQTPSVII